MKNHQTSKATSLLKLYKTSWLSKVTGLVPDKGLRGLSNITYEPMGGLASFILPSPSCTRCLRRQDLLQSYKRYGNLSNTRKVNHMKEEFKKTSNSYNQMALYLLFQAKIRTTLLTFYARVWEAIVSFSHLAQVDLLTISFHQEVALKKQEKHPWSCQHVRSILKESRKQSYYHLRILRSSVLAPRPRQITRLALQVHFHQ